jgi:PEGA domain
VGFPSGSKSLSDSRATLRDGWTSIGQTLKRWFTRSASTEASEATIQVSVDRGSAVVSIDGIPRGLAPLTVSVSSGHHTVSVSGALDYEASTREIDSQSGQSLSLSFRSATKR